MTTKRADEARKGILASSLALGADVINVLFTLGGAGRVLDRIADARAARKKLRATRRDRV